jgi:hypothetical protein
MGKKEKGFCLEEGGPRSRKEKAQREKTTTEPPTTAKSWQELWPRSSVREAALEYGVKRSTLHDIIRRKVAEEVGRPTVLDNKISVERLLLMSEWGFPMTCAELRHLIKAYLDGLRKTTRFVGNLLGRDCEWVHEEEPHSHHQDHLQDQEGKGHRVSSKGVEDFFKRFAKTAEGVPPTHMYNYDESGLNDDPGADKAC